MEQNTARTFLAAVFFYFLCIGLLFAYMTKMSLVFLSGVLVGAILMVIVIFFASPYLKGNHENNTGKRGMGWVLISPLIGIAMAAIIRSIGSTNISHFIFGALNTMSVILLGWIAFFFKPPQSRDSTKSSYYIENEEEKWRRQQLQRRQDEKKWHQERRRNKKE